MKNKFTSLKFSKKLVEAGFKFDTAYHWRVFDDNEYIASKTEGGYVEKGKICKTVDCYDILNDICATYVQKLFREKEINKHAIIILGMIQACHSKKLIEDYIWKHCLFNPKNKEKYAKN